ncbi:MAG: protein kinase [Clostridia bacterium]
MITAGSIIGHRYRVQEIIGTGGMAHVYRAVNLANHRTVAIKVLKEEFIDDAEFLRRFEREARAVLQLSHDNIVRAYGVGEVDNLPYIVLEYVEGQTLKQIIVENGPMPPRLAVALATQVLAALSAAHSAGIIHRDVKPQNVIVTPTGRAKLTDFGIARDVTASTVTFAGSTILGSVHYLSPEQAKGKPVTEGSDLYSVGIMLYEMLTGQVPFDNENSVAVALMHLHDDAVPPIQHNSRISPALNDVIMRALNKNLSERYTTATEMSQHLKRALVEPNGDFMHVYTPELLSSTKKKKKKKQFHGTLKIGVTVAAIVAVMIGIFLVLRNSYQTESVSMEIIPTLTERTAEEARQKAQNYGFAFEVREYEVNDSVPYGDVILQSPESGTKSKLGATIYVTISLGPDIPKMPDLLGMTPDEAEDALTQNGLMLGNTQYRVSDTEIGYVCSQSILSGSEVQPGATVDIWISATSSTTFPMPNVSDEILNLMLGVLSQQSFSNVFVRYDTTSKAENGVVISQQPQADDAVLCETPIYLTVSGTKQAYSYSSDLAFNLDIDNNSTQVFFALQEAYNGFSYYRIVYETTLEKGTKIPVSFTAYSDVEGSRELILFVGGKESKRQDVSFVSKVQ